MHECKTAGQDGRGNLLRCEASAGEMSVCGALNFEDHGVGEVFFEVGCSRLTKAGGSPLDAPRVFENELSLYR